MKKKKHILIAIIVITLFLALIALGVTAYERYYYSQYAMTAKPVVYLYPEEPTEVTVQLEYSGTLHYTYPTYHDGWQVTATPDGTIYSDGKEYAYLFWDGYSDTEYDMSQGFVVAGEDTEAFLVETLATLGLTPTEYNEFIVYWLPQMIGNQYNLITFQEEAYTDSAVLAITPEPDSILRVFMVYSALEEPLEIETQTLTPFVREGFTVIEWGGTEILR